MDDAGTSDLEAFKVVLLGEGAVGKSSILLRYIENKFNHKHLSTTQASFTSRKLTVDGKTIELNIWDTAGQEKYHSLGPIYYRGSQGAILIYDITDVKSFERIKNWVRELQEVLKGSVCLVVVGNKVDLEGSRNVDMQTAKEYAESVGALYLECSAKENIGINSLFDEIAKLMITRAKESTLTRNSSLRRSSSRRTIQVVDDEEPPPKKGCYMSGPQIASRIAHAARGLSQPTAYGKRMDRLSNRIFGEVVRPTDIRSSKVVRIMSAEPLEQREDKSVKYYPNLPMFHYLTKMLRFHGIFFDDHVVWRRVQDELKVLRGKVVRPVIGQGKRAQIRGKK